jgi:PAS domain S-box-containing protein/putative nucleotidyltransferase with HDIG domain
MKNATYTILALEDNPDDVLLMKHRLEQHFASLELIIAQDQAAFKTAANREDIDAIIVDNQLGWTTGIELIPEIKQRWPFTPVIMFTVTGSEEMAVQIMKLGVDDYLLKSPTQYARIPHVIEQLIDQYEIRSALQHSELINQSMIQNVQEGIIVYDNELRYRVWNRFMEKVTGKNAEEVIGKVSYEVFPHLVQSGIHEILKRVLEGETIRSSDIPYYVEATGKTGWTQGTYSPLVDPLGKTYGVLATLHDITERKRNESERESLLTIERQRALLLARLNTAAKEIAAATDKDMLFDLLSRHLMQITAAKSCRILIPEQRIDQMVLKDRPESDKGGDVTLVIPTAEQMQTLKSGEPQLLRSREEDKEQPAEWLLRMAIRVQRQTLALIELKANVFSEQTRIVTQTLLEHAGIALTEIESLEQERLLRLQAETLRDVAQMLNAPNQLDTVLDLILTQLKQVVNFDNATIMLLHDDLIRIEAALGVQDVREFIGYDFTLEENRVVHPCIYANQRVYLPDVREEEDWIVVRGLEDVRSWIATPLLVRGQCMGVLTVDGFEVDQFDEKDIDFVNTFGSHAATAIENARLLTETTQALQREQQLNQIAFTISQNIDTGILLETIARQATEVVNGDIASIILINPESGEMIDLFYHNKPHNIDFTKLDQKREDGLIWDVLSKGITQVEVDYSNHPQAMPEWVEVGVHGFVAVPLWAGERIIGGLAIFSLDATHRFDQRAVAIVESIGRQAGIGLENARLYEELEEAFVETVLALANAMDVRDSYTGEHSQRMADLAVEVGRRLGCNPKELEVLRWAALLHDIGKIGVPDDILLKPASLTKKEYETIKRHPELGASIVAPVKKLQHVAPIIRGHQEWFNGKGYPDKLKGEEIPLGARILAVVDSYTAITDQRVYRDARSHEFAIAELVRGKNKQYDPAVVDIFLAILAENEREKTAATE